MAGLWFCKLAGVTTGPLKASELRALADSGKLAPDDLVRQGAEGPWVAARHVRGLFGPPRRSGPNDSLESASSEEVPLVELIGSGGMASSGSQTGRAGEGVPTARLLSQPPPLPEDTISKTQQAETNEADFSEGSALDLPKAPRPPISAVPGVPLPTALQRRRTQNNVLMIVGLAVTAVVLLMVVILMLTGVIPLQNPEAQKKPTDSDKNLAAANQAELSEATEITWVDASKKGIRRGTTLVSILSARLAAPPAAWVEKPGEYLLLDIQIRNHADDKFLFFAGWSRGLPDRTLLRLVDNKGTAYRQTPRMDLLGGDSASLERIPPGGTAKDTLVFEPPKQLEGIEYFRLELPGRTFPKEKFDPFRFQIAAKMIRTGEESSVPATKAEELFGPSKPSKTPPKTAPSKEEEPPPVPKRKLDPGREELERLMKELEEKEEPSPSGPEQKKPPKGKSSAPGKGETEPAEETEPADSKPTKPRRPRLPGQDLLDQLDTRVPPKEPSKEKE